MCLWVCMCASLRVCVCSCKRWIRVNFLQQKCDLRSISSMFYLRVYRTKVIFWQLFSSFKPKTQRCNLVPKFCTKNACVKRWWNWYLVSSPVTYGRCLSLTFPLSLSHIHILSLCLFPCLSLGSLLSLYLSRLSRKTENIPLFVILISWVTRHARPAWLRELNC